MNKGESGSNVPAAAAQGRDRSDDAPDLDVGFISSLIPQLARAHRAHAYTLLRDIGLAPSQELLLMHLWRHGPQRPAQLAEVLGVTAPTVSKMITRMEKAGLVRKESSETDRRASVISCTDKGNGLQGAVQQTWVELEQRTLRSLDEREERELRTILTRVIADLDSQMKSTTDAKGQGIMEMRQQMKVLIVGVGGLGAAMIDEALERGVQVSVMVRDETKLRNRLDEETLGKLERITVGDATDPSALDAAMQGVDVVLSGRGAHQRMAREMARAVKRNKVQKLCWPAGGSNVMAEDGITPVYRKYADNWPGAEDVYHAHQVCIDEIRDTGVNYVIFCPGRMSSKGFRSKGTDLVVRINRETGMFVSYEDAAWVMLEGAVTDAYDHQLVSAATIA